MAQTTEQLKKTNPAVSAFIQTSGLGHRAAGRWSEPDWHSIGRQPMSFREHSDFRHRTLSVSPASPAIITEPDSLIPQNRLARTLAFEVWLLPGEEFAEPFAIEIQFRSVLIGANR